MTQDLRSLTVDELDLITGAAGKTGGGLPPRTPKPKDPWDPQPWPPIGPGGTGPTFPIPPKGPILV
jgi:hypothetical protein